MVKPKDTIADFYRMYIRRCESLGINYDFMRAIKCDYKGFDDAFRLRKFDFLSESFEIEVKDRGLFIEVMRELNYEYSFDEVMSIVKHINQVDAFKISLEFVDYGEASDIPNRFICEENMRDILELFPNARNDKTINEVLKLKAITDEEDFVYEYTNSEINDIGKAPLSYYAYGELDENELKEIFPLEEDEEYDISEEVFLVSFNSYFPEELLQTAFEASIHDNFCLQDWHWLSNPNRIIRVKYLEFIAKNEEKVIKICGDSASQTILEYILSHKMIDYSDVEDIVGLLKKKESIFSEDFVSSIEDMIYDSKYMGDRDKLLDLLKNRYHELEKLERKEDSKEKPVSKSPTDKKGNKTTKDTSDNVPIVDHLGSVVYRNTTHPNKCKTVVVTNSSSKSLSNQKSFRKTHLVKTEYKKPNEIVLELNQAKTRVISKQLIKLTSEPIKSFLLSKKIDNSVIEGFIDSKYFNSVVGAALFAGGNNISFNNKSLENAKNEVFQEIKIESISSFGNEIVDIVRGSLIGVIEKFTSKRKIHSKENVKDSKPKKLSDGKKANTKVNENKKTTVKNK